MALASGCKPEAAAPGGSSTASAEDVAASADNMRSIVDSIAQFREDIGEFPPGYVVNDEGEPTLSWRVAMLPALGHQDLFDRFNLEEPWDSENNRPLADEMPDVFRSPLSKAAPGETTYLAVGGESGVMGTPDGVSMHRLRDGTSITLLLVEVASDRAVIWTEPQDYVPNAANPVEGLAQMSDGKCLVALVDTSIQLIAADVPSETWASMFTYKGGEIMSSDFLPEIKLIDPRNPRGGKARLDSAPTLREER